MAAGEKQGNQLLPALGDDPAGEQTGSLRRLLGWFLVFGHQLQDLHRGIIVVQEFALSRLADELIEDWLELPGNVVDQIPLGRCRQWDPEVALELLQTVKRKARTVL